MTRKTWISAIAVGLLGLTLSERALADEVRPDQITIFTSVAGSSWYGIGAGMADIFAQNGVPSNAELGAGLSNVANVAARKGELGLTMSPAVTVAALGRDPFKQPVTNVAVIAALSESLMHIMVNGDEDIETVADLQGRPFVTQPAGSITAVMFEEVLKAHSLEPEDLRLSKGSLTVQQDELKDRRADGIVSVASFPSSWIGELASTMPIRVLAISDTALGKIQESMPTVGRASMPVNTYKGQNEPVSTVTAKMVIVAAANMPDGHAYWITRSLVENLDKLRTLHASYADLTPEEMASVPGGGLHPGAEEYYREIGALN